MAIDHMVCLWRIASYPYYYDEDGRKRDAVFSVIGLAAVLFVYFGVNYLPELHNYGSY